MNKVIDFKIATESLQAAFEDIHAQVTAALAAGETPAFPDGKLVQGTNAYSVTLDLLSRAYNRMANKAGSLEEYKAISTWKDSSPTGVQPPANNTHSHFFRPKR